MTGQQQLAAPKPNGTSGTVIPLKSADTAMQEHLQGLGKQVPIPLGFPTMDRVCSPSSGRLWVIGGRPGAFKTGLVWNMAVNAAQSKRRALVVSLEVTPGELALMAVARFSGLGTRRIVAAHAEEHPLRFTPIELERFERARETLRSLDLYLRLHGAATHGRNLADVMASATRHRYDAIFVDHIGMIGRGAGQREELQLLGEAVDRLRALTDGEVVKGYTPFVCMTTPLNRESEREKSRGKEGERRFPRMSDFRGSSRLESDADAGIVLEKRDLGGENDSPVAIVEALVVKNRHGPHPKFFQLVANGETQLVRERMSKDRAEAEASLDLPMPPGTPDAPEPGWEG
jgi:replicative DNA helicase